MADGTGDSSGAVPAEGRVLEVSDPVALRALAHPLRQRLLRLIRDRRRPVTGAELAELTGESTASISYHLSVLAKHGFIEPDPASGPTRRHKPWRATYDRLRITSDEPGSTPLESPGGALLATWLAETRAEQDAYLSRPVVSPADDVALFTMTQVVLDANAADAMSAEIEAVLERYRRDDAPLGPGQAEFSASFVVVPRSQSDQEAQS